MYPINQAKVNEEAGATTIHSLCEQEVPWFNVAMDLVSLMKKLQGREEWDHVLPDVLQRRAETKALTIDRRETVRCKQWVRRHTLNEIDWIRGKTRTM